MFQIEKRLKGKLGRAGILKTVHGVIHTPAFVAVGTKATVKALTPAQITETGAQVVLGNTYHLYLEPGEKVVEQAGGVGKFMGWEGPTMTDSGGFQVFSLGAAFGQKVGKVTASSLVSAPASQGFGGGKRSDLSPDVRSVLGEPPTFSRRPGDDTRTGTLVSIDEDGVTFKSYKDGSEHRFTPERSIEIQHALGADIIFAFDECTSPEASYEYQKEAMERTHQWALRSLAEHQRIRKGLTLGLEKGQSLAKSQALFGIVQGGRYENLRKESAKVIGDMRIDGLAPHSGFAEFAGFGIGGSFDKEDMGNAVRWVNELLPEEKPRHLLGIGGVSDLFAAVENGCDLFDCVAPTREARTGSLYTKHGRINITNARFRADFSPLEKDCLCYSCRPRRKGGAGFTKAYLAHLFRAQELLAYTLASIHSLSFFVSLVQNMREAILDGSFARYKRDFLLHYTHAYSD